MKLFHGSNVMVKNPKLISQARALDFGAGFYLTSSLEQASKWAKVMTKRRGMGTPIVSVFEINMERLINLDILKFEKANAGWLDCVCTNRKNKLMSKAYDIIIGPVADDNTMPVLNLYLKGDYTKEEALRRLLPQKLKDQYVFKTEKAISILKFSEVIKL